MSEDGIKRWTNNVDFESSNCIQSLYTMYLGTKGSGKSLRLVNGSYLALMLIFVW